uniref:Uncharacterized protein n=1 Tax=Anguilla anguilla TaxID=7936 RepID=A0A0E9T3J2_ANGAN
MRRFHRNAHSVNIVCPVSLRSAGCICSATVYCGQLSGRRRWA